MKIVGIMACGMYYSPWGPWTISSIYPICDEIIIVNNGYDLNDLRDDKFVPVERISKDIKFLDVKHKITEITHPSIDMFEHKAMLTTQFAINKYAIMNSYDIRGFNLTLANEQAIKHGAEYILKIDSDQVLYNDCLKLRDEHFTPPNGFNFYQYEFKGNLRHLAVPPPDSPFNDSVFIYPAIPGQWYAFGGAPDIRSNIIHTDRFHSSHLRLANPSILSEKEIVEHWYGRMLFSKYTNQCGCWCDKVKQDALDSATHLAKNWNNDARPSDAPPPEITNVGYDELPAYLEKLCT